MRQVIYAWNYLEWGGAQIHILALIKEVRKRFDVLVVLPQDSSPQFLSFLDELNIPHKFFSKHTYSGTPSTVIQKLKRHWVKLRSELAMIRAIGEVARNGAVYHVDLSPQQSLFSLALLSLRAPVFITSHNALPPVGPLRELLWRIKFRVISLFPNFNVFCSNKDARDYYARYYSPDVTERIGITYTSIDPTEIEGVLGSQFDRAELLNQHGIPSDQPIVLAVGQFIDRKGRWVFLEAAKNVARTNPEVLFLWMTPQEPNDDDKQKIESYGLGSSFRTVLSSSVGNSRHEILSFFRVADVFALPSFVEGLPIALLEAMALGVPSISTNVNGIPEAVKNNETGLLIEAGDSDALASGIRKVLNDKAFAERIARTGREYVIRHFDERDAARTALERYLRVVDPGE